VQARAVTTAVAVALIVFACRQWVADRPLSTQIWSAARKSNPAAVSMAAVATFDWDRMHVFPPYMSARAIEHELGFAWLQSDAMEDSDGFVLLVFVKDHRVVRYVKQDRRTDFARCGREGGFARAEAVFRCVEVSPADRRCDIGGG
jgi:hypothetical protein